MYAAKCTRIPECTVTDPAVNPTDRQTAAQLGLPD